MGIIEDLYVTDLIKINDQDNGITYFCIQDLIYTGRISMNFYNIPIFIISYNRTETLKICLERFLKDGYKNIIVLDNHSSVPEHIQYLKSLTCKVVFLDKNYGQRVLWQCGLFDEVIAHSYFVVTDPDILPIEDCPGDYVEKFYDILQQYPKKTKAGFSLKIDDLPDDYQYKFDIIRRELFYWEHRLPYKFAIYDAQIDTTFALYRPGGGGIEDAFYEGVRTGGKYIARHLGWYPSEYGQRDYYNQVDKNRDSASTAVNELVMKRSRLFVIAALAAQQNENIYQIIRAICTVQFMKTHATWKTIGRGIVRILKRKIEVDLKMK